MTPRNWVWKKFIEFVEFYVQWTEAIGTFPKWNISLLNLVNLPNLGNLINH